MAQVVFNRELEIILVRLNVGGVNADESQVLPVGVDTGASTTVIPRRIALRRVPLYKDVHNNDETNGCQSKK